MNNEELQKKLWGLIEEDSAEDLDLIVRLLSDEQLERLDEEDLLLGLSGVDSEALERKEMRKLLIKNTRDHVASIKKEKARSLEKFKEIWRKSTKNV